MNSLWETILELSDCIFTWNACSLEQINAECSKVKPFFGTVSLCRSAQIYFIAEFAHTAARLSFGDWKIYELANLHDFKKQGENLDIKNLKLEKKASHTCDRPNCSEWQKSKISFLFYSIFRNTQQRQSTTSWGINIIRVWGVKFGEEKKQEAKKINNAVMQVLAVGTKAESWGIQTQNCDSLSWVGAG